MAEFPNRATPLTAELKIVNEIDQLGEQTFQLKEKCRDTDVCKSDFNCTL